MKLITIIVFNLFLLFQLSAQSYWADVSLPNAKSEEGVTYQKARTLSLDWKMLRDQLQNAPLEFSIPAKSNSTTLLLPLPKGENILFKVVESPVMMPGISARFPDIKSYKAFAVNDESITARFDISPNDFHASIRTKEGRIYIDPIEGSEKFYRSFYLKETELEDGLQEQLSCGVLEEEMEEAVNADKYKAKSSDEKSGSAVLDLRTYRLAISCTGEYGARKGGTVASVLATFNTATNRLNEIYENEVAIRFLLIDETDQLIFLDGDTDPFFMPTDGLSVRNQNPEVINERVGLDAYDIGHAFTNGCDNGLGGVAAFGVICQPNKALGMTCHFSSSVSFMVVNVMAHEVGHQFTATHSWHNCPSSLDQRSSNSAYEPGGGSTIMSYNSCGEQNIIGTNDDYFHSASLQQIINFSRNGGGNNCPQIVVAGNNEPEVSLDYTNGFSIPISTPFELHASASDAENNPLTYCWEQYDLEPAITDIQTPRGNAPLFRSLPPTSSSTRVFPEIRDIIANRIDDTEKLPDYSRGLKFRCTVRDNNRSAGAVAWQEVSFRSDDTAGPFIVTSPNNNVSEWEGGSYQEITWDVANTNNARVNCQRVNIKLSTDGGLNYPITLLENAANDGSAFVTIPTLLTNTARIKVEAADNIFFDISNRNISIVAPSQAGFAIRTTPFYQEICLPNTVTVDINAEALLDFDAPIILSVDNLPDGVTASFSMDTLTTAESVILTLDAEEAGVTGNIAIDLIAAVAGLDTLVRPIELSLVSNDFSDLSLLTPSNNTRGIIGTTEFTWTDLPNVDTYDFEIASSPTFGATTVLSETGLTRTSLRPEVFLEENTIYYWRIRPSNQCGAGAFSVPNVFQSVNVQCVPFSQDVTETIPSNGTPTIESTITIDVDATITDLNIPIVVGSYPPVRFIEMSLISPAGTQVILFDNICGSTNSFNLGFDDEAPDAISCPPTAGVIQRPIGNLSDFDGENLRGDWKLRFRVKESGFGNAGEITNWTIESCGDIAVSAPFLVTNETFEIPPATRSQIWTPTLEADDADNRPSEISFQLVAVPENGTLYRNEIALKVGDSFTQQDINGYLISYEHDGSETATDQFIFILLDTDGGWFGTAQFNIVISEDATVDTEDVPLAQQIKVYPNPAENLLNIEVTNATLENVNLQIFHLNGQLVKEIQTLLNGNNYIDVSNLPNGIYLLSLRSESGNYIEKVVVQR